MAAKSVFEPLMRRALQLAVRAGEAGEVPVAALVLDGSLRVIAEAENRRVRDCDPTAHAEILALRLAGRALNNWQLPGHTLLVTLEPCAMCASAIAQARIVHVVFALDSTARQHQGVFPTNVSITRHVLRDEAQSILSGWFKATLRESRQVHDDDERQGRQTEKLTK